MQDIFINIGALMETDWFKNLPNRQPPQKEQVLKSLRVEDETYRQLRSKPSVLDQIEQDAENKLPTIKNLSRDVFQSFYALTLRHNEESELTPRVRRFNRYLLDKLMQQPDFPAVKSICEGRSFQAMEATEEFMQRISGQLEELLQSANGGKQLLDALELQEKKQYQRLALVHRLAQKERRGFPRTKRKKCWLKQTSCTTKRNSSGG